MKQDLTPYNIQDYWQQGIHISSKGIAYQISDMPAPYLQNVIDKFGNMGYDVSMFISALDATENTVVPTTSDAPVDNLSQ